MELPKRAKGDQYLQPGQYSRMQSQLHRRAAQQNTPVLFINAFDYRTRVGPCLFIDKMLVPGAPLAVGAALHAAGFDNLRLVLQQWTPRIRPSLARLDGRIPEILLITSMHPHSAAVYDLIRDAWTLGADRPLILAGGSKAIYEPWDLFGLSVEGSVGADAVCTGEQFVLLELLDRIFQHKSAGETLHRAFERLRREGTLEDIAGLVYRGDGGDGPPQYLVNTGIQRLVQDLDELPLPFASLGLFEPPHRSRTLRPVPLAVERLRRHAKVLAAVTTHGCKFQCSYCPIPAYNQYTFRHKSPERIVEELAGFRERTGIKRYFGTDDNFFHHRQTVEDVFTAMSRAQANGKPFRQVIDFSTEATEYDVLKNRDLIPLARDAGLRQIWFGVEDMTAELVKKGQSPEKIEELFRLLTANGIAPNPMLMHHDGQPLWTPGRVYGLLNQAKFLHRAGAASFQATFLTPAPGSRGYEQPYHDGMVFARVGGKPVENHHYDGNMMATILSLPTTRNPGASSGTWPLPTRISTTRFTCCGRR